MSLQKTVQVVNNFDGRGFSLNPLLGSFSCPVEPPRQDNKPGWTVDRWLGANQRLAMAAYLEHGDTHPELGPRCSVGHVARLSYNDGNDGLLRVNGMLHKGNPGYERIVELQQQGRLGGSITYRHDPPDANGDISYIELVSFSFTESPYHPWALVDHFQSNKAATAPPMSTEVPAAVPAAAAPPAAAPVPQFDLKEHMNLTVAQAKRAAELELQLKAEQEKLAAKEQELTAKMELVRKFEEAEEKRAAAERDAARRAMVAEFAPALAATSTFEAANDEHIAALGEQLSANPQLVSTFKPLATEFVKVSSELANTKHQLDYLLAQIQSGTPLSTLPASLPASLGTPVSTAPATATGTKRTADGEAPAKRAAAEQPAVDAATRSITFGPRPTPAAAAPAAAPPAAAEPAPAPQRTAQQQQNVAANILGTMLQKLEPERGFVDGQLSLEAPSRQLVTVAQSNHAMASKSFQSLAQNKIVAPLCAPTLQQQDAAAMLAVANELVNYMSTPTTMPVFTMQDLPRGPNNVPIPLPEIKPEPHVQPPRPSPLARYVQESSSLYGSIQL
jgi:hypothetical protein